MTRTNRELFQTLIEKSSSTLESASIGIDSSSGSTQQTIKVKQGEREYEVQALDSADYGGRTVEEFYAYGKGDGASANTPNGMERSDLSQLFFYDGPAEGDVSLVFIHDAPNDGDGGAVTFQFDHLPDGDWVVPDDSGDDDYDREEIGWRWVRCCTDGGAYRGGFDTAFWCEVHPDFHYGIDSTEYEHPWVVVDGSGSSLERHPLDPTESISIASGGELYTTDEDTDFTVDFSTNVCADVENQETDICVSSSPAVQIGPRSCGSEPGGVTPPLASVEIPYVEEEETEDGTSVTYEQTFWIGIELNGEPCIWYGEENFDICGKLQGCRTAPRPNAFGVPDPNDALQAAEEVLDDIERSAPEIRLPPGAGRDILEGIIALGIVILAILFLPAEITAAIAIGAIAIVAVATQELSSDDEEQT